MTSDVTRAKPSTRLFIGTSTAAGFLLMRWVREWRFDEEDRDAPEASA